MMDQEHIRNIALIAEDVAVVCAVAEADAEVREQLERELGPTLRRIHQSSEVAKFVARSHPEFSHISRSFACSTWRGEV